MKHPDDWSDDDMLAMLVDDIGILILVAACILLVCFGFAALVHKGVI